MHNRAIRVMLALVVAVGPTAMASCGRDTPGDHSAVTPTTAVPQGAVSLDTVQQYPAVTVRLATPNPATVELPETEELLEQLASAGMDAVVRIDFGHVTPKPDFALLVFVNTPGVDADTPTTAPGYIGTITFYPDDGAETAPFLFPAGRAITSTGRSGSVILTVVPVTPDRTPAPSLLDMTASAALVRYAAD